MRHEGRASEAVSGPEAGNKASNPFRDYRIRVGENTYGLQNGVEEYAKVSQLQRQNVSGQTKIKLYRYWKFFRRVILHLEFEGMNVQMREILFLECLLY